MVLHNRNNLPPTVTEANVDRGRSQHVYGDPVDPSEIDEAWELAHNPLYSKTGDVIRDIEKVLIDSWQISSDPHAGGYDWTSNVPGRSRREYGIDGGYAIAALANRENDPAYKVTHPDEVLVSYMSGSVLPLLEAKEGVDSELVAGAHPGVTKTEAFRAENDNAAVDIEQRILAKKVEINNVPPAKPGLKRRLEREVRSLEANRAHFEAMEAAFDAGYEIDQPVTAANDFMEKAEALKVNPRDPKAIKEYDVALAALKARAKLNESEEALYRYLSSGDSHNKYVRSRVVTAPGMDEFIEVYTPPTPTAKQKMQRKTELKDVLDAARPGLDKKSLETLEKLKNLDIEHAQMRLEGLRRQMATRGTGLGNKARNAISNITGNAVFGEPVDDEALEADYKKSLHDYVGLVYKKEYGEDFFELASHEQRLVLAARAALDEQRELTTLKTTLLKQTWPSHVFRWTAEHPFIAGGALAATSIFTLGSPVIVATLLASGAVSFSKLDRKFRGLRPIENTLNKEKVVAGAHMTGSAVGSNFLNYIEGATTVSLEDYRKQKAREAYMKRFGHLAAVGAGVFDVTQGIVNAHGGSAVTWVA